MDGPVASSHTGAFDAWLRSRGGAAVFTASDAAQAFGVVRTSYEPVSLADSVPASSLAVKCVGAGKPEDALVLQEEATPATLEWGEACVEWRYAPISPADLFSARLGGVYGSDVAKPPYAAGHDGVGVVLQVGPGVQPEALRPGDVVLPARTFVGTWRRRAVVRQQGLLRVPRAVLELLPAAAARGLQVVDTPPGAASAAAATTPGPDERGVGGDVAGLELLALARELATAHLLLHNHASHLQAGDTVLLNAPLSTVGRTITQLARARGLRVAAVARAPAARPEAATAASWAAVQSELAALGAATVLPDEGSLRVALLAGGGGRLPRLALDCVGGDSALRMADALADVRVAEQGGEVVHFGCMSGQAPVYPWTSWVFRELRVCGFNLRLWMASPAPPPPLAPLAHAANAAPPQPREDDGTTVAGDSALDADAAAAAQHRPLFPALQAVLRLMAAGVVAVRIQRHELAEFGRALAQGQAQGRDGKVVLRCAS